MSGAGAGVAMGANLAGGIMQAAAASLAAKEMYNSFNKELRRQRGYALQGQETMLPYLQSWGNADADIAKGAGERMASYQSLYGVPLGLYSTGMPGDRAAYEMAGQRRAGLGGYGDWMFGQGLGEQTNQQRIADIIDQARGQAGVFPYRMYKAQHSWDELAAWGQLIQSIGGAAGNYMQLAGAPPPQPQRQPVYANPNYGSYNMPGVFEPPNYGY